MKLMEFYLDAKNENIAKEIFSNIAGTCGACDHLDWALILKRMGGVKLSSEEKETLKNSGGYYPWDDENGIEDEPAFCLDAEDDVMDNFVCFNSQSGVEFKFYIGEEALENAIHLMYQAIPSHLWDQGWQRCASHNEIDRFEYPVCISIDFNRDSKVLLAEILTIIGRIYKKYALGFTPPLRKLIGVAVEERLSRWARSFRDNTVLYNAINLM